MLNQYGLNKQQIQETTTKNVTFEVSPLMCMEKCGARISAALSKINVSVPQFDIPNKRITVTMPESMQNDQIIGQLQQFGFKSNQYFPAAQTTEKRIMFGNF